MQTRRTNLNHHHQEALDKEEMAVSPEAELIALAAGKGQVLTADTLRVIRECLELRGVTLADFVADVRIHFRNNIRNPSGFLIDRARRFRALSRPAQVPNQSSGPDASRASACATCGGQQYVLITNGDKRIEPCPACSTADFRKEWERKEAGRNRTRMEGSPRKSDLVTPKQ